MRAGATARIGRRLGTLANTLNEFLMRDRTGTVVVEGVKQVFSDYRPSGS